MDKVIAQVGQIIEVNGKQYRATEGGFEPVEVKKGPLGGELKELRRCKDGEIVYIKCKVNSLCTGNSLTVIGGVHSGALIETNIPPRPTFTPMTAGEAAKLPDIVGRWVAVQVEKTDGYEVVLGDEKYERWFDGDDQILLIEGVDLP